mmetsp:Transcript_100296/g.279383  ORF Transcript_100296/g.279383 Transcript_100296/m.279383 type:complete len:211 (-) Transcript_100296:796-1428(-)
MTASKLAVVRNWCSPQSTPGVARTSKCSAKWFEWKARTVTRAGNMDVSTKTMAPCRNGRKKSGKRWQATMAARAQAPSTREAASGLARLGSRSAPIPNGAIEPTAKWEANGHAWFGVHGVALVNRQILISCFRFSSGSRCVLVWGWWPVTCSLCHLSAEWPTKPTIEACAKALCRDGKSGIRMPWIASWPRPVSTSLDRALTRHARPLKG